MAIGDYSDYMCILRVYIYIYIYVLWLVVEHIVAIS